MGYGSGVLVYASRRRGRCRAAVAAEDRGMPERRWRVATGPRRGLFQIDIDDGQGFRPATTAEVDAALRQRELFGAADHPTMEVGRDPRLGTPRTPRRRRPTAGRSPPSDASPP